MIKMRLDRYCGSGFDRGASVGREIAWIICSALSLSTWLPGSGWRVWLLRVFGSHIGKGVVIKPRVQIKFPWKLTVGDHCWIGEKVWIDNLAVVSIGNHVCISQGAYLCTGSHDWGKLGFDLITKPIRVEDHVWIAALSRVAPGVVVSEGAVLSFGSVATDSLAPWMIHQGIPAAPVRSRPRISDQTIHPANVPITPGDS